MGTAPSCSSPGSTTGLYSSIGSRVVLVLLVLFMLESYCYAGFWMLGVMARYIIDTGALIFHGASLPSNPNFMWLGFDVCALPNFGLCDFLYQRR